MTPPPIPTATMTAVTDDAIFSTADALLSSNQRDRWLRDRTHYRPMLHLARDTTGTVRAAALTSTRPGSSYVKIIDVIGELDVYGASVLDTLIADARMSGLACVKWEVWHDADPSLALSRGFAPLPSPILSGPGTEDHVEGMVLWLDGRKNVRDLPYYRQTAGFTCGAVASLIAASRFTEPPLSAERTWEQNRDSEIGFWRSATSFFPCEPIGVSVALREDVLPSSTLMDVYLDTTEPFFTEEHWGYNGAYRIELQQDFRRRAAQLGIPVHNQRIEMAEITDQLAHGGLALIVIAQSVLHPGDSMGHWVLAHSPHGGTVLLQDSLVKAERGETWVDSTLLPVPLDSMDEMAVMEGRARGVILLGGDGQAKT